MQHDKLDVVHALFEFEHIGLREHNVFAHDKESLYLVTGRFHHFVQVESGLRGQRDAPGFFVFGQNFGIVDALVARQKNRCGARVIGALDIVLSAQWIHSGRGMAQMARHKDKVGQGIYVVGAVGMFGNAQRVVDARFFGLGIGSGRPANVFGKDARYFFGFFR